MKDSHSNTNYTNVILNLFQDLNKEKAAFNLLYIDLSTY